MRREHDKVPLGNVILIIIHGSNVTLHMHTLAIHFHGGQCSPPTPSSLESSVIVAGLAALDPL